MRLSAGDVLGRRSRQRQHAHGSCPAYRGQSPADTLPDPAPHLPRTVPNRSRPGPRFPRRPSEPARPREPSGLVLGVSIIGNKKVKETEILRHIKTRKDRNYDEQLVQEDLRRLFATRKFHNVRVHKKIEPQGVYVTFEVLESPDD